MSTRTKSWTRFGQWQSTACAQKSRHAELLKPQKRTARYTAGVRAARTAGRYRWFVRNHPEVSPTPRSSQALGAAEGDQAQSRCAACTWNRANHQTSVDPVTLGLIRLQQKARRPGSRGGREKAKGRR